MTTSKPMNREELERLGALLFGYGWKSSLAAALEVNRKTVSRWIADDKVADWAAESLRSMVRIAPPPGSTSEQDRDDACAEALEPDLTRLTLLAQAAGWERAEIATAMLALSLSEIRELAGDEVALETLEQARLAILGGSGQ